MKRVTFILLCIFSFCFVNAQGKRIIKDNFETNKFQWEEFYEDSYSSSIQDGFLELKNEDEEKMAWSIAELPINTDRNFDISFNFHVKEINDEYWFGIVFNYEDSDNFNYLIVQEKRFQLINRVNGVSSIIRRNNIILKEGDEKDVKIVMNKKGKKLTFLVDEMEVVSVTKNIDNNTFGCIVVGENSIKLTEVVMEQIEEI